MKDNKKNIVVSLSTTLLICYSLTGCSNKIPSYYDNTQRVRYFEDDPVFHIGETNNGVEKYDTRWY